MDICKIAVNDRAWDLSDLRYWKAPEEEVAEYYDDIVPNLEDWGANQHERTVSRPLQSSLNRGIKHR